MTITQFGWIFLAALACLVVARPAWLAALVIVSAVLHAPVVLVVSSGDARFGITPWQVASAAAIAALALWLLRTGRWTQARAALRQPLFLGWTVFFAGSIIGGAILPQLFAGLDTYNIASTESIAQGPEPLEWRPVYSVHALNFLLLWALFLAVQLCAGLAEVRRAAYAGVLVAAALSVAVSIAQRAWAEAGLAQPEALLASLNPAYVQTPYQQYGSFLRVGLPFSEPSYASAWFAALFGAGLGLFLFTRSWVLSTALMAGGAFGLLNALGGSGLAGAVLASLVLLVLAMAKWWRGRASTRPLGARLAGIFAVAALVLGGFSAVAWSGKCSNWCPSQLYREIVEPRLADYRRSDHTRHSSNVHAVRVIGQTGGLGVGLGANRASSNLLSMASTIGVPLTLLFYALLVRQRAGPREATKNERVIYGSGSLAMLCSAIAGIPDLAWPAYWIWILASFCLVADPASAGAGNQRGRAEPPTPEGSACPVATAGTPHVPR